MRIFYSLNFIFCSCLMVFSPQQTSAQELPSFFGLYARTNDGGLIEIPRMPEDMVFDYRLDPIAVRRVSSRCVMISPSILSISLLDGEMLRSKIISIEIENVRELIFNSRLQNLDISIFPIISAKENLEVKLQTRVDAHNQRVYCADWSYGVVLRDFDDVLEITMLKPSGGSVTWDSSDLYPDLRFLAVASMGRHLMVSDCEIGEEDIKIGAIDDVNSLIGLGSETELLSNLVFEGSRSCGDLVLVCGFNSVFERDAVDDFGEVVKAA